MDNAAATPRLQVDYLDTGLATLLREPDVLAVFGFGDAAPRSDDPRYLQVGLQPHGTAPLEVWRGVGPVRHGRDGDVAWASDGRLQFGAIEIDEPAIAAGDDDIGAAAAEAYRRMLGFIDTSGYPHLLRIWNYLDGITEGRDDDERYRRFCVGRAAGLGGFEPTRLPAATAIGRLDGRRRLQVYWLAAKAPGTPLENPRQLSAYRYPRQYGPQSPSFARALLPPPGSAMPLLLSGTAAIVGHESRHADSVETQLDETLANFDSLLATAHARRPSLPTRFGPGSRLKVYVRDAAELAHVEQLLADRLDPAVPRIVLHAAICRRELRIEIDGVHDL
ncbi:pteridine-dependent deoxygenase [Lysobacter arseniciresistens ZS79]|uniref:Pteridine-dependent deoxygenase n=1 Tax=Lysobacter arseniciresistens ZS79 TaxID=913325 RepID=A0A0A0EXF2_9GAMM|nr:pteridine-dependent deoxygenase [Lysobacter arseniciresistens]KGM54925.1 pteridine-dependent deoxygenase [Lysobacter arseniciresistens ZS79]